MPLLGNIKTRGELQDDLFCVQEERDYFQSKFLEQVSEIQAMKEELSKSKKEIRRLRMFLMDQEQANAKTMPDQIRTPKNHGGGGTNTTSPFGTSDEEEDESGGEHLAEKDDASSLTEEVEDLDDDRMGGSATTPRNAENDGEHGETADEEEDVRKSAEKLLAWASYRSTSRASLGASQRSLSHNGDQDYSSVMSPSGLTRQSLLGKMIETLEDASDDDASKELGGHNHAAQQHGHYEEKKEEGSALGVAALSLDPVAGE